MGNIGKRRGYFKGYLTNMRDCEERNRNENEKMRGGCICSHDAINSPIQTFYMLRYTLDARCLKFLI